MKVTEVIIFLSIIIIPIIGAIHLSKTSPVYKKGIECHINPKCVQLGYFNFGSH